MTARYPLVLTALIAADATAAFEAAMLTSAVPELIAEFQIRTTAVGWAFTGFTLTATAAAVIGGRLGDLFGRKKVLVIVPLLSIVGSVVSFGIGTYPAIIAGRAVQGVRGAVLPLVVGISREAVAPRRVPVTIAVVALSSSVVPGTELPGLGRTASRSAWARPGCSSASRWSSWSATAVRVSGLVRT